MTQRLGRSGSWLPACLIFFWATTTAHAERILDYKADLAASANGTLRVEERIDYDFGDLQRHGIFRDIPNTVPGPWGRRRALEITGISIEQDLGTVPWIEESVHGDAGPMLRLRVGNPDATITGRHVYTISYEVSDALLPAGERDSFRWNAIGTGWSVPIDSARVRLTLPVELNGHPDLESRFFTGAWGSTDQEGRPSWNPREGIYSVTAGPLPPHQGVTVEVSFPVGAIAATAHPSSGKAFWQALPHLWAWPMMLLGLGLAWRHWYRVGRDPFTGAVAVRYRPPEGLEAAEAGLLMDHSLDKADLTGSVVELARDGGLRIERPEERGGMLKLLKPDRITLARLQSRGDWTGLPPYKRYLMESFFCRGDRYSPGGQESATEVGERKQWFDKAKSRIHERGVEHGLFPESPKRVRTKYVAGAAILSLLLMGIAFWRSSLLVENKLPGLFILGFITVSAVTWVQRLRRRRRSLFPLLLVTAITIALIYQLLPYIRAQLTFSLPGWGFILTDPLVPTLVLVVGLLLFAWQMPRRTGKGARVRRELLGFRKFMRRAEAPRLRAMLKQDPHYFEHTLPFAALFGLVSEWSRRFEGLAAMPQWYEGGTLSHLGHDLNRLSSSGVTSSPPASSGGSSGGGGFSGGGGGGGGGGSW